MSINKVILIGNVGKDPEVRYFDNGGAVANFTLATTERGYTATNGTIVPDRTDWHNIVCWRTLAEIAEKYVKKGSKIYIEGKIRTRSYDDATGNKRYVTEIYAETLELLDRKPDSQSGGAPFVQQETAPAYSNASKSGLSAPNPPLGDEDAKDDLPF